MIDVAEWVAARIYALQVTSWEQWVLRGLLLVAGIGCALLVEPWVAVVVVNPWWLVTAALVVGAVLWPDSLAPLFALVPLVLAWLGGGAEGPWWRHLAVVVLLALFHLLASNAAAAPTFAVITRRAAARMALGTAAFLGLTAAVAGVLLALRLL